MSNPSQPRRLVDQLLVLDVVLAQATVARVVDAADDAASTSAAGATAAVRGW